MISMLRLLNLNNLFFVIKSTFIASTEIAIQKVRYRKWDTNKQQVKQCIEGSPQSPAAGDPSPQSAIFRIQGQSNGESGEAD
jgi:hypothetical protein